MTFEAFLKGIFQDQYKLSLVDSICENVDYHKTNNVHSSLISFKARQAKPLFYALVSFQYVLFSQNLHVSRSYIKFVHIYVTVYS